MPDLYRYPPHDGWDIEVTRIRHGHGLPERARNQR